MTDPPVPSGRRAPDTRPMAARRRSLRTELLANLGFVTSAAVIIVGLTTVLLAGGDIQRTLAPFVVLWLGSTAVFVLFGAHLVHRVVIRPLVRLAAEADTLACGRLIGGSPEYETAELADLAWRYRMMAADLLDAQSYLVRVEKLAGIGSLAAGVAHEVRNPLGAVSTYVDLLRQRGADPELTDAMRVAIGRIERTVQSLLAYARPNGEAGPADLNQAIEASVDFLEAQGMLKDHRLLVELEPELEPVMGNRHLLEQVVVNLVVNACQASPRGRIVVGTARQTYQPRGREATRRSDLWEAVTGDVRARRDPVWTPRPHRSDVAPGTPGVLLFVADDGPGVREEDRERVFDPFYTTKDPGEGTGLGLAIVARTVHNSGGTVWVDRAREGGAAFKVFLPFAPEPAPLLAETSHATAHC